MRKPEAYPDWRVPRNSPGPALLQIALGQHETVVGFGHGLQALVFGTCPHGSGISRQ